MIKRKPTQRLSDVVLEQIRKKVGHLIFNSRSGSDITQEELAIEMGLSAQSIRDWESGRREPSTARIAEIGKALDRIIKPEYQLDTSQGPSVGESIMPIATKMVHEILDSMNPRDTIGVIPYMGVVKTENAIDEEEAARLEKEFDDAFGTDAGYPFPKFFIDQYPNMFAVRVRGKGLASIGYEPGTVVFVNPRGHIELGTRYLAKASGELVIGLIETWNSQLVLTVEGPDKEPRRLGLVLGQEGESDAAEVLGEVQAAYRPAINSVKIEQP